MEQPIINPPNPYVGTLRIFPGTLVKVSGRPRPNATRFAINLQTGPSLNPRDDLALHLSPCFTPPRVVRNSLHHGNWQLEEAWGNGAPINPHQPFEIIILAEPDQFKIAINGLHYCEFKHRIPYQEITHLTIDGDLDIERISITSAPGSSPSHPSPAASAYHHQPSAPPTSNMPPYPTSGATGMPMPSAYPTLPGGGPPQPTGFYPPSSGGYAPPSSGPMPAAATYMSGYPPGHAAGGPPGGPYPHIPSGQYQPGAYPAMPPHGPSPTGASYQGGYPPPQHQQQQQPGHSSSSPFGSLPIGGKALGTLAGLGLAGAAGAAILSAANPLKKIMKPKKMFKHKGGGWGRSSSSSSSSNSSRGSFSSNSS